MMTKWREKDVYAHHIKHSYEEVIQKLDRLAHLTKWRDRREVLSIKEDFIKTTKRTKQINGNRFKEFWETQKGTEDFQLRLKTLRLSAYEHERRFRIKTLRHAKRLYKKSLPLSKKFKKAVGKSSFKRKLVPKTKLSKRSLYDHASFYETIKRHAAVAKSVKQEKMIWAFYDGFKAYKRKQYDKQILRNNRFIRFFGAPVNSYDLIRTFDEIDKLMDEHKRAIFIKHMKKAYHRNYSLTKSFNQKKSKLIERER